MPVQKYVDTDVIGFLIPVICKPGEQSKPFARRECLRLLGALTSTICPRADVVFSTSNLMSRICSYVAFFPSCSRSPTAAACNELLYAG